MLTFKRHVNSTLATFLARWCRFGPVVVGSTQTPLRPFWLTLSTTRWISALGERTSVVRAFWLDRVTTFCRALTIPFWRLTTTTPASSPFSPHQTNLAMRSSSRVKRTSRILTAYHRSVSVLSSIMNVMMWTSMHWCSASKHPAQPIVKRCSPTTTKRRLRVGKMSLGQIRSTMTSL